MGFPCWLADFPFWAGWVRPKVHQTLNGEGRIVESGPLEQAAAQLQTQTELLNSSMNNAWPPAALQLLLEGR